MLLTDESLAGGTCVPGSASGSAVGVVIPMYNGARTIRETLASVLGQSHRMLDVVVVDDGSRDDGALIVEEAACKDRRVRLLRQENAGVAAARNAGAVAATGEYLAFVDADDLWAPDKIERQLARLQTAGSAAGLVYSWSALIDEQSRIISLDQRQSFEGCVLSELCRQNFVGNGSSFLVRRQLFEAVGGFDPGLRAAGAQGAEDYLFCLEAAERTDFCVVPEFLTGYRQVAGSMAGNVLVMQRSIGLALERIRDRHPELAEDAAVGLNGLSWWLIRKAAAAGQVSAVRQLLAKLSPDERRNGLLVTARWALRFPAKALLPPGSRLRTILQRPALFPSVPPRSLVAAGMAAAP